MAFPWSDLTSYILIAWLLIATGQNLISIGQGVRNMVRATNKRRNERVIARANRQMRLYEARLLPLAWLTAAYVRVRWGRRWPEPRRGRRAD